MDFTIILIGLAVIIALFIVGKIFAILTKIFVVILIVAALTVGFFIWKNNNGEVSQKQVGCHTVTEFFLSVKNL